MNKEYKIVLINPVLVSIIGILFLLQCTDTGPTTADIVIPGEKSITKNGITFYDYTDSLYKSWGFDSASNAISVPARSDYRCGLRVHRGEDAENYDSVKIEAGGPFPIIARIDPQYLEKDTMNYLTIYPFDVTGNCSLNVYAGNSDLRGMDDYWGRGPIHFMYAHAYTPIVQDTVYYLLACPSPKTNPPADELCTKMNHVVHQAVVHIERIAKTTDNTANWDGKVFIHPDPSVKVLDYVFTSEANFQYNAEYKSLYDDYIFDHIHKCNILQVPYIALCWRTEVAHDSGSQQIILETSSGEKFLKPGGAYYFGFQDDPNTEFIDIEGVTDSIVTLSSPLFVDHPAGHVIYEMQITLAGLARRSHNICIVRDYSEYDRLMYNICHEFMHLLPNGELGHTNDTENLMYPTDTYRGTKLRYRTKTDGILQWDDVHN